MGKRCKSAAAPATVSEDETPLRHWATGKAGLKMIRKPGDHPFDQSIHLRWEGRVDFLSLKTCRQAGYYFARKVKNEEDIFS
jgi:hypothetical protein